MGKEKGIYIVVDDDNLSTIAAQHGTTPSALIALNKDKYPSLETNPDLIYPNWELKLTETAVAASPATPPIPQPRPEVTKQTAKSEQAPPTATATPPLPQPRPEFAKKTAKAVPEAAKEPRALDEHQAREIQQKLLDAGYKLPKYGADNDWGKESRAAAAQWQKDNGYEETGDLTGEQYTQLRSQANARLEQVREQQTAKARAEAQKPQTQETAETQKPKAPEQAQTQTAPPPAPTAKTNAPQEPQMPAIPREAYKVLIDPGHGTGSGTHGDPGSGLGTPGAVFKHNGHSYTERDMNMVFSTQLAQKLSALGITSSFTRDDNHGLDIKDDAHGGYARGRHAIDNGYSAFVSIHVDSKPGSGSFILTGHNSSSVALGQTIDARFNHMGGQDPKKAPLTLTCKRNDEGDCVTTLQAFNQPGVNGDSEGTDTNIPGILIELGSGNNRADFERLTNAADQDIITTQIALGIADQALQEGYTINADVKQAMEDGAYKAPTQQTAQTPSDIDVALHSIQGLSKADKKAIQSALNRDGRDIGDVDGIIGNDTKRGLRGFFSEHPDLVGKPATEIADYMRAKILKLPTESSIRLSRSFHEKTLPIEGKTAEIVATEHAQGRWAMVALPTQKFTSGGHSVDEGNLYLISPSGETYLFPFSSGPAGRGATPGLNEDYNPDDNTSVVYQFSPDERYFNSPNTPGYLTFNDAAGYKATTHWRMVTPSEVWNDTEFGHSERGIKKEFGPQGSLALHGDQGIRGETAYGTEGCIGIGRDHTRIFEELMAVIDKSQWPTQIVIMDKNRELEIATEQAIEKGAQQATLRTPDNGMNL